MAISLKEQLQQITEGIHYHPPFINVIKKGKEDPKTKKQATQMFYDFYAMELMHRLLGSPKQDPDLNNPKYTGNLTPAQAAKLKTSVQTGGDNAVGAMFVPNWNDIEDVPQGIGMVPSGLRKVIDQLYEEVVIALTEKMMAHLRLTLIQEFRYIVSHASDWKSFRHALVAVFNKEGKLSKKDFNTLISQKIPGFKGHEDTVKRLLLFSKYYDAMSPDPADSIPAETEPPKVGTQVAPKPEEPSEPEPDPKSVPMAGPDEPDDTDYNMPPVEIPPGADWDDDDWKNNPDVEKEKIKQWLKAKKGLSEGAHDSSYAAGRISPHTVLAVRQAINKSGLTWNDILLAYENLNWGGAYGGPKWGAGVESLIKLMPQAKHHNVEEMAAIVDHIYDLEHNTGELLNKGGMFVGSSDLDRRAKITSLSRYLPNVSPLIKRLILRVLKYVSKHPDLEQQVEKVTQSPTVPFTAEEQKILTACRFVNMGNEWTTQAPYENKKGQTVQNQYTVKHHTGGLYSAKDSIDADVQIFDTWDEFHEWIERNKNSFIMPQAGTSHYEAPKVQTMKDGLLSAHQKIKIVDVKKETDLLEICKMAWRPSNNYYKAYLPGTDRVQLFAFSDGSYMVCKKSEPNNVFHTYDWDAMFVRCKELTLNALPNNEYDEGKAWIGKSMHAPAPQVSPQGSSQQGVPPTVGQPPQAEYSLSPIESQTIDILAKQKSGVTTQQNAMPDGFFVIQAAGKTTLMVGKKALLPTGKKYKVIHIYDDGQDEWTFPNFNITYNFISHNFGALTQVTDKSVLDVVNSPASVTSPMFSQQPATTLPAHSPSKAAYTAHLGIDKPPTHTIRLTAADESLMANLGFHPKMAGADVWYVHAQTEDIVKFYPNNSAKILFLKTNNKVVISKTIDDALAWLQGHYTASSGAISPISKPPASAKGQKAGAMYEKILSDAGFVWNDSSGMYVQSETTDTIYIKPFPKSTFTDAHSGEKKTFGSLPELANFVKNYAPSVKKK